MLSRSGTARPVADRRAELERLYKRAWRTWTRPAADPLAGTDHGHPYLPLLEIRQRMATRVRPATGHLYGGLLEEAREAADPRQQPRALRRGRRLTSSTNTRAPTGSRGSLQPTGDGQEGAGRLGLRYWTSRRLGSGTRLNVSGSLLSVSQRIDPLSLASRGSRRLRIGRGLSYRFRTSPACSPPAQWPRATARGRPAPALSSEGSLRPALAGRRGRTLVPAALDGPARRRLPGPPPCQARRRYGDGHPRRPKPYAPEAPARTGPD